MTVSGYGGLPTTATASTLRPDHLCFARDDTKHEPRSLVEPERSPSRGSAKTPSDAGELVTFSGPRGVTIFCRPKGVRRAISNLVDNAVKYGGSATVSLIPKAGRFVITVEDSGPGIPRSEREKSSIRSTGLKALGTPIQAVSDSVSPSHVR